MDYFSSFRCLRSTTIVFLVFGACFAFSDEWKARHPLISPTGVMNLSELPSADEIFFAGPQDPADAQTWRAGLKVWRTERLLRLRYDGSQYERPELAWTQGCLPDTASRLGPRRGRAGTIGFRCVVDAQ